MNQIPKFGCQFCPCLSHPTTSAPVCRLYGCELANGPNDDDLNKTSECIKDRPQIVIKDKSSGLPMDNIFQINRESRHIREAIEGIGDRVEKLEDWVFSSIPLDSKKP